MLRSSLLAALLMPAVGLAQDAPDTLTHQGRLLDPAGGPINGRVTLDVRILDASGVVLHSEQVEPTLQNGFYSVVLGASAPLSDDVFADSERYVEVAVNGVALGPRSPITSTPFAQRASQAQRATEALNVTGDITPSSLSIGAARIDPSGAISVGGQSVVTADGSLPMSGRSCPDGQVVSGFEPSGAVQCRTVAAVPSGLIGFFAGDCPAGFTEYTPLSGRAVVGLSPGGVVEGPVGTPLEPGGLRQITQVPAHAHAVNPPATASTSAGAHTHSVDPPSAGSSATGNHFHDVDAPQASTTTTGAHAHSVDPPSTSSSTTGSHAHSVDPPSTSTNTTGNHNHRAYAPVHDTNSSASQGYPNGDNHQSFRSSDRARQRTIASAAISSNGNHAHTVNIGAFNSSSTGNHAHTIDIAAFSSGSDGNHAHVVDLPSFRSSTTGNHTHTIDIGSFTSGASEAHEHTVDIGAFDSASTGQSAVDVTMPYLQLRACRAR